jgi:hypothetical protein
MAGIRGAGRKHEGLPSGLSGETGTCSVLSHCAPCDARSIVELCQTAKSGKLERSAASAVPAGVVVIDIVALQGVAKHKGNRWRCTDSQEPMRLDRLAT